MVEETAKETYSADKMMEEESNREEEMINGEGKQETEPESISDQRNQFLSESRNRHDMGRYLLPSGEIPLTCEEYGKRLKYRREAVGTLQRVLAQAVGCSQQNITQIEKGERTSVNREYIPVFAELLGCTAGYLAGFSDDPNKSLGNLGTPILMSAEGEIVDMTAIIRGYQRDPDLARLCIQLLKGDSGQRKYYKRELKRILKK